MGRKENKECGTIELLKKNKRYIKFYGLMELKNKKLKIKRYGRRYRIRIYKPKKYKLRRYTSKEI